MHAISTDRVKAAVALVPVVGDLNLISDKKNRSCLHLAVTMHSPTIVQAMVEKGLSLTSQDIDGQTAIQYAEEVAMKQSSSNINDLISKFDATILSYLKSAMLQKDWQGQTAGSRLSMNMLPDEQQDSLSRTTKPKLERPPIPTIVGSRAQSDDSIHSSVRSAASGARNLHSKLNKSVNDATSDSDGDLDSELDNITEDEWVAMGFPLEEYQERLRRKMAQMADSQELKKSTNSVAKHQSPTVTVSGVVISDGTLNLFGKSSESLRRSSAGRPQSEYIAASPRISQTMGRRPSSTIENANFLAAYRHNSSAKDLLGAGEVVYNPLSRRGSVALVSAPKLDEVFGGSPVPSHLFSLAETSRKLTQGSGDDMFRSNADLQSSRSSKSKSSLSSSARQNASNKNIIENVDDGPKLEVQTKLRSQMLKWCALLGYDDSDATSDLPHLMEVFQESLQLFHSNFEKLESQVDESSVYKSQVSQLNLKLQIAQTTIEGLQEAVGQQSGVCVHVDDGEEVKDLKAQLETAYGTIFELEEASENRNAEETPDLQQTVSQLSKELEAAKTTIEDLKDSRANFNSQTQAELLELREQLRQAQGDNASSSDKEDTIKKFSDETRHLTVQLQSAKNTSEIPPADNSVSIYKERIARLNAQLKSSDARIQELEKLAESSKEIRSDSDTGKNTTDSLAAAAQLKQQLADTVAQFTHVRSESNTTKKRIEELEEEALEHENSSSDMQQNISNMAASLRDKELVILDLQADLNDEREQVEQSVKANQNSEATE